MQTRSFPLYKIPILIFSLLSVGILSLTGCTQVESLTSTKTRNSAKIFSESEHSMYQPLFSSELKELENLHNRTVGVYALNPNTHTVLEYNSTQSFPFASTMKAIAAGLVLQQKSSTELEQRVTYTEEDLVPHSPVTEQYVKEGMKLSDIAEAAVRESDNTALNLMIQSLGGIESYAQLVQNLAGPDANINRFETELNSATPGEKLDTISPHAMAQALYSLTLGDTLTPEQQDTLKNWMSHNATGDNLIRAGAPQDSIVLDKSGAAAYGTRNDIALVYPAGQGPVLLVIFITGAGTEEDKTPDSLVADIATLTLQYMQ